MWHEGGRGSLEGGAQEEELAYSWQACRLAHSRAVRHCHAHDLRIALGLRTWKEEGIGRVNVCGWIYRPRIYLHCQGDGAAGLSHPEWEGRTWRLWWAEPTCTGPPQAHSVSALA